MVQAQELPLNLLMEHKFMKRIFKTIISMVLVLCMLAPFATCLSAKIKKGDMDADGKIRLSDAERLLRIAAGVEIPTEKILSIADMDSDGAVTIEDVKKALEKAVDINPEWTLKKIVQLTPDEKHNSSTKVKFCRVKSYCAETLPASPVNDRSNPLYSPLMKGTYDYVKSGPVKDGASGNEFYVLASGRRVYTDNVKVFTGYKMPYNNAQLRNHITYDADSTKIYLALDWRVPFNVTINPQKYESGYDGREFNIKEGKFTGKYIDFVFDYTTSANGELTFPESDTIKSCEWIMDKEDKTATLRIHFRKQGEFYGYSATYNKNNFLVISIKEPTEKLKGRTIALDPGHGGDDPGAGSGTGVYESDVTYKIALQLKKYLENQGATVVFTRDNSESVPDIKERRITTMKTDPDLYIAIHLDAAQSRSVHGSSVYYYKNYSGLLAKSISENLPSTLKNEVGYKMTDRGYHFYPFHVTRVENCPSVLVECGFISNTTPIFTPSADAKSQANCDFKLLNSSTGQKAVAKGIYNGILEYFGI